MAVIQGPFLALVLLLVSHGLQCSPVLPACPAPCLCQRAPLLNCSSSGLSQAPHHIHATVTELDLSHNLLNSITLHEPHPKLRRVWLGNNSITQLSLCAERAMGSHHVRGRHSHRLRLRGGQGCVSWAPALQLLSVERNQLVQVPEGIGGSKSLQVLQLSFNWISTLQQGDLSHLWQLEELHLQHNLITSVHSQAFRDLPHLRVLDLSFNLLTSLHPMSYLSLHNLGADVRLSGNRWQCDCSMYTLRRLMDYNSKTGQQAWSMVCATPSTFSGRDLLQLAEEDLICFDAENKPGLHQDVTVDRGSEILLSCSTEQDSTWWTPNGQVPVSQPQAGLLISEITERDSGLYVCVSESDQEIVSAFNLQIRKIGETKRKTRIPRTLPKSSQFIIPQGISHRMAQVRNQTTTQSDLTLAVCLSVFITFLVAFILGVLARPLFDRLCRRVCNKGRSAPKGAVSSAGERQYDNEAYYSGEEEPEEIGAHRERRVTFSTADFREHGNVPYYDTVASGNEENINEDAVSECGGAETNHQSKRDKTRAGDSGSESSSSEDNEGGGKKRSGVSDPGPTHSMEFEHIPDEVDLERRRSSSSNSDTSLSHKVKKEEQGTQRHSCNRGSLQQLEDPFQPRSESPTVRSVEVPKIAIDSRGEIPGFSSEPFADWSPSINDSSLMDPDLWQENGEKFEFSDSQTPSARSSSVFDSFNNSNQIPFPTQDNLKRSDSSSSSSSSHVSGNEITEYTFNPEREEKEDTEMTSKQLLAHDAKSKIAKQGVHFEQEILDIDPIRSSLSGDGFSQGDYKRDTWQPSVGSDSSHSSDSDDEPTQYTFEQETDEEKEGGNKVSRSDKPASKIIPAGGDRTEEVSPMPWTEPETKQSGLGWGVPHIPKRSNIKAPLPPVAHSSSSSSDSEAEMADHKMAQDKDRIKVGSTNQKPETLLPVLDQLATKAPSPSPDSSSSSESADETTDHIAKQGQEKVKKSQSISHEPETRWPDLDLAGTIGIKRRLDIKPRSPRSDSSSTSESEEKTMDHTVKQGREEALITDSKYNQSPLNPVSPKRAIRISPGFSTSSREELEKTATVDFSIPSTKVEPEPESRWPDLSLSSSSLHVKRRLDIKAPSPPPESSSSSSESEDETSDTIVKLERDRIDVGITSNQPETKFPDLGLGVPKISRSLDIKAPSQQDDSSSSSSDSETSMTSQTVKKERERAYVGITSNKTETKLPDLSLGVPKISRRLDIKAPSQQDDSSSSSSDSENKTTGQTVKQERNRADVGIKGNQLETKLPDLSLGVPKISRRLDIKAPSQQDDSSSSSSDSENKMTSQTVKQERNRADVGIKGNQLEVMVPDLSLGVPKISRRLDIKAPSQQDDSSSSSSDSETSMTSQTVKQERERAYVGITSNKPETKLPGLSLGVPKISRRLDIKAPSQQDDSSSSSSDSENRTTGQTVKQERNRADVGIKGNQLEAMVPDLSLGVPKIGRRLDIKAPSQQDDSSSSSSDSENKMTSQTVKQERNRADVGIKGNQLEAMVPDLSLGIPKISRRLDIKAPSQQDDSSSSSSDSENKMTPQTVKQERNRADVGIKGNQLEVMVPDLSLGVPKISRRLDIKAPSQQDDSSSSSSDSETSMTSQTVKQERERAYVGITSNKPETKLPGLSLGVPKISRRLDIKAPSQQDDSSSSSSDSENRTTGQTVKQERNRADVGIKGNQLEAMVPDLSLGVPKIGRRLDIKAPSQHDVSSSSSSDSETRTTGQTVKVQLEAMVPDLSLGVPRIKRRLDIKAPSPEPSPFVSSVSPRPLTAESNSSRSESEDENRAKLEMEIPVVLKRTEKESIKSLTATPTNIFGTSTKSAYSIKLEKYAVFTDEGHKTTTENLSPPPKVNPELESQWAGLHLGISRFRKRLDITSPKSPPPKVPSLPSRESSSSSSESEDDSKSSRGRRKRGETGMKATIYKESSLTTVSQPMTDSINLKNADNIASDKSADVKERLRKDYSFPTTEENPDPDAIWAGQRVPHVKRYLDIKVTEKDPSTPPKLSHSSSSSESEDEVAGHALSLYPSKAVNISIDQLDSSMDKVEKNAKLDLKSQTLNVEEDPELRWPQVGLSNVPRIKRRLDIKAPSPSPSESSSSSKSEDDITDHTVQQERDSAHKRITSPVCETKLPDLSLGIPRVKRYLDVKAPSPQPTDSLSTSDNKNRDRMDLFGITHTQSQLITHRHLNIKAPSPPGDSSSSSSEDETTERVKQRTKAAEKFTSEYSTHNVKKISTSLALSRVPSTSFDDVVKRRIEQARRTQDVDLPSNLLQTGVDHHLSDHSISSPRRRLDVSFQRPKEAPPAIPGNPPSDSSSSSSSESGDEVKRVREEAEITSLHKYSSLSPVSVSLAPSRALDKFDNSSNSTNERVWSATPEDRKDRKGLSALRALSSERRKWDSGREETDMGSSPPWNNQGSSFQDATTYYKSEKDTQPLGKLSLPELLLSSAKNERGARGLQHPIPRHRRHVVGGIQLPQEAPPPVPETPPPDEGVAGPKWRSPLSSERQEWRSMSSYQQQDGGMEGSGPSSPSSISQGDDGKRSPRLIDLLGAAPYHTARQYQGLTTTTTQHYVESTVTHTSSSKSYTVQFDSSSMNITDV